MDVHTADSEHDRRSKAAVQSARVAAIEAQQSGDWNTAAAAWREYCDLAPHLSVGYVLRAAALCKIGQLAEAEAMLEVATALFPEDITVVTSFAQVATRRRDWVQALTRWRRVRALAPETRDGFVGEAAALLGLAQPAMAEAVLVAGLALCRDDTDLLCGLARVAQRQQQWAQAVERWRRVIDLAPDRAEGYLGEAAAHHALGNFPAAHRVLRQAARYMGRSTDLIVSGAHAALACGRSLSAKCHWDVVGALYADHRIVRNVRGVDPVDLRTLLLGFESIGGNCEFGLVQRHMRAEPLGLLRWTAIFPDDAAKALSDGLEGVGEMAHTDAAVDKSGEYLLRDMRYGMGMHTFVKATDVPIAAFLDKQCARMVFLRDKLLESLRNGSKIFVYWQPNLTNAQLAALHEAVRSRGSATLLGVRVATMSENSPSVSVIAPGLLLGLIDRDGRQGARQGWDIAYDQWAAICLQAQILCGMDRPRVARP